MTPAEICALSQASFDKLQSLKKDFDSVFEALAVSGSSKDLQRAAALQEQIEYSLRSLPVAYSAEQLSDKARVYIGKFESGMFKNFPQSVEHIYTEFFPHEERWPESLQIGGKTNQELQELIQQQESQGISKRVKFMLDGADFIMSEEPEDIDIICLHLDDLGLRKKCSIYEVYERAAELGLELCPPEVGPYYLLSHHKPASIESVFVGMKPIADGPDGSPSIFMIGSDTDMPWLESAWVESDSNNWGPSDQFLFRIRKAA